MGLLMGKLAKEIVISVICQKALKSFGKSDYADVVRLGGWCVYGCTIVQMYKWVMSNSVIISFFESLL
ncbi:hypothetical protein [Clostridium sulfidigenes]|uniref:hypothetical protein n=1 Tax=Clostridium sulfidigenes TaxID=318464 RepID=UPI003F8B54F7